MPKIKTDQNMTLASKIFILSLITLILGLFGYFIFWNHWIRYIFAHIGALGIIGIFAFLVGIIADKKDFSFRTAASITFYPSIIIGIIADYIVDPPRESGLPSSCGGIVSLAYVIIVTITYLMINKKNSK